MAHVCVAGQFVSGCSERLGSLSTLGLDLNELVMHISENRAVELKIRYFPLQAKSEPKGCENSGSDVLLGISHQLGSLSEYTSESVFSLSWLESFIAFPPGFYSIACLVLLSLRTMAEAHREPVGFFDSRIKDVKCRVYYQWARTVLLLCIMILSVMSLFWASQFRVPQKMHNLTVWVVDFDGQEETRHDVREDPIVGPAIMKVTHSMASVTTGLAYTIQSPADFNYDPQALKQAVYDEHVYAAVIVSSNATALLLHAVRNGDSSYRPTEAAQFVTISARDQTTYSTYIEPALNTFEREVLGYFGPRWVEQLAEQNTSSQLLQTNARQAINPAIGFDRLDLRPFSPAVAIPAVTVGLIYLIILAFFIFPFLMPVHMQLLKGNHPPLKTSHWVVWRITSNLAAYFFLAFSYSLVSLAFQIPFNNTPARGFESALNPNAYGRGSFVVFWMLNWVGMAALGFPCENMAMLLGAPYSSIFLIFWVITNVSTGFYALDLAPSFFRWGYAWPLHRIVEALRTILFGTHSRIGLDFGILFAWVGVSIALYPFANYVMQWKQKRASRSPK
ncbi:hypothetical protein FE257_006710 [Aspergillus nanangensis]|uniref:DUF3533 domain-containing protein n=1 Tax=Aspergillus nanangensis TaxID=2582783 RepID=A0AAD4CNY2_ASPNN|nr:hypothetical protein FE257_006710 [Aspergillus nanangensis]